MSDPCQRYQHLIKTADNTIDDPTGWVSTWWDYDEWRALAQRFVELVEQNVTIATNEAGAIPPEYGEAAVKLRADLDRLPGWFDPEHFVTTYEQASRMAIKVAQGAACTLGELEDYISGIGATAMVPLDKTKPKPQDDTYLDEIATGAGFGLVVIVGLWLWSRRDG